MSLGQDKFYCWRLKLAYRGLLQMGKQWATHVSHCATKIVRLLAETCPF
jgi:hypothetical protein